MWRVLSGPMDGIDGSVKCSFQPLIQPLIPEFLDCWGAFVSALQKVGWLLARQLPNTTINNSCNATRIEHSHV